MIIGIDLGTTNSLAAVLSDDGPRLIPNALGDVLTPSVVGIDLQDHLLVGRTARELSISSPERCAARFKRYMGTEWQTQLAGRRFNAVELSSLVLKSLKIDAEAMLGSTVDRAVITVPAYFNEHQRKATIYAGQLAGLNVERILNEPTAAAIAYGYQENPDEQTIAVLDLGGGTFDISIVERFQGVLEVRASAGETFLGGEDFTHAMAARIVEQSGRLFERAEHEAPRMIARLLNECELAKKQLTLLETAVIRIPNDQGEFAECPHTVEITRAQFELWTEPILRRIEMPIRRALGDAQIQKNAIHDVLLVGGATRMPCVKKRALEIFARDPRVGLNPDEAVALGASVQAALIDRATALEDLVVTDVAPFTLGIEVSHTLAGTHRSGYFLPIIHRNTTIPTSRVKRIETVYPNQAHIKIRVFQGENRRVDENVNLGELKLDEIPLGPAGQEVDVRFTYDLNGVLEVEATIVATGRKINHVITKLTHGLAPEDIQKAVLELQLLKTHPREEARHQHLLRWAERMFRELPVRERQHLELLLTGFEDALEMQEPQLIEQHRAELQGFLETLCGEIGEDSPKNDWIDDDETDDN